MPPDLARRIKEEARSLGFEGVGIAPPTPSGHGAFYRRWLEEGANGEMSYLARPDAVDRREDLTGTLPTVGSVVVVAHEYFTEDPPGVPDDPSVGVIARYARGRDYHRVVEKKLRRLLRRIREMADREVEGRAYVDTGPLLERELGQRAGLGWFGRNTMLIHPRRGSWFFLGALLLDLDLEPDEPFEADHCGSCHACLDACPTGALLGRDEDGAPVIDARRCISYLTIENPGAIPRDLRPLIGNRIYGCDICQEVCPFNARFAEETDEPGYAARGPGELPTGVQPVPGVEPLPGEYGSDGRFGPGDDRLAEGVSAETRPDASVDDPGVAEDVSAETSGRTHAHPGTEAPPLVELMRMTREDWDAFSRGSAIRRAGYAGFKRNVAVALGNWGSSSAVPVLREALREEAPLVRGHCAWALGEIRTEEARSVLLERSGVEEDPLVRTALKQALEE